MPKKNTSPRTELIAFRVTPREQRLIQRAADADNRTLSSWVRIQILDAIPAKTEKG